MKSMGTAGIYEKQSQRRYGGLSALRSSEADAWPAFPRFSVHDYAEGCQLRWFYIELRTFQFGIR